MSNKERAPQRSLFITLGIIIISTVVIIMSFDLAYKFIITKNQITENIQQSSRMSTASLQKNIVNLIASYSVNEYDNIVFTEMTLRDNFAIVIEDYNMGKIIGQPSYISGKIRDSKWNIIDYDPENIEHNRLINESYYSKKTDITGVSGEKLATIGIYVSDRSMSESLNNIVIESIINTVALTFLLIFTLFITIRRFVLKPLSKIIAVINDSDNDGIPFQKIPHHSSREINLLSNAMNRMVDTIKSSREVLKQQHNELQTLSMATEQSPVSIIICKPSLIIEYVNPQFVKSSGYEKYEIVSHSIERLFQHNSADKKKFDAIKKSLSIGKRWIGEITPLNKDGGEYSLRISVSPISLDDNSISHSIYVAEDITQQKINEEILRNSQKMDAVGQLTGGIAHDFNNLLGIIMGNLELLKMTLKHPKELERIEHALTSTQRGAQLTRKLLNFSRQAKKQEQIIVHINHHIEEMHDLISKSLTVTIQVETHLADDLWPVLVNMGDLEDALLNLSLNARDAMPKGGLLIIETANKYLDSNYAKRHPNVKEGDYVMVSVSDTGTGMSKEMQKKIFDPFFSTKEFGKGTGLGLSMVYGFVQRSDAHIQVYSEEGEGSSFRIYIPRAIEESDKKTIIELPKLPRGNETILIVDDEEKLLEVAESSLKQLGYQTLIAANGREALEILTTTEGINMIFSDVVMPGGVNGYQLAFAATKQQPTIKILLTSGFTSKREEFINGEQQIYLELTNNLLGKPYNMRELSEAIRDALDK